jgi:hypothetical protein
VLLYELGEGAPDEALKPDSGALGQLAVALMQVCVAGGGGGGWWRVAGGGWRRVALPLRIPSPVTGLLFSPKWRPASSDLVNRLIPPLLSSDQANLPCARHRLVALAVLETYVRYSRVLQHHQAAIPQALTTFLDERGLGHPSEVMGAGGGGGYFVQHVSLGGCSLVGGGMEGA